MLECTAASTGHHVAASRQLAQAPCPPGFYSDQVAQQSCTPCQPGTFQNGQGMAECWPAVPGSYVSVQAQPNVLVCPKGEYSSANGSRFCRRCNDDALQGYGPNFTTSTTGLTECDQCIPNHYMALDRTCPECDRNSMDCSGLINGITLTTMRLKRGHHRFLNTTDVPYIKPCPFPPACLGGVPVGDLSCKNGSMGPLCAVCEENHYLLEHTGECKECDQMGPLFINTFVLALALALCASSVQTQHRHLMRALEAMDQNMRSHLQFMLRGTLMPKIKVCQTTHPCNPES